MHRFDPLSRRGFLRLAPATLAATLVPGLVRGAEPTPPQMEGPYYPREAQTATRPGAWRDNDLTEIPGFAGTARGTRLVITGQVLDTGARPQGGALVEIWQACESGRYLSTKDRRRGREHDPAFQYWGSCATDQHGRYAFKTIVPPSYPSGVLPGWVRPPHIHVRVRRPGERDFVTQLYFDDPDRADNREVNLALQRRDLLLHGVPTGKREQLVRPVRALSAEPMAMLHGSHLDSGLPWTGLLGARWVDFPIVLDPQLWMD